MSRREMLLFPFRLVWAKRHDLDLAVIFVALTNPIKLQNHQQKSEPPMKLAFDVK